MPPPKITHTNNHNERRRSPRVQLDAPCFVSLHLGDGRDFQVMITDIATHGVQFLLPPHCDSSSLPGAKGIELNGFPPLLAHMNGTKISVVWCGLHNCGALFEYPLVTPLEEILRLLDENPD